MRLVLVAALMLIILWGATGVGVAQESQSATAPAVLALSEAVMCEGIDQLSPKNPGLAFSKQLGEVACYTAFDPVPEETVIYHHWFHRDRSSSRKRLRLKPPRWATFSRIQFRQGDEGPWRVEVIDDKGRRLAVLRFSIVE